MDTGNSVGSKLIWHGFSEGLGVLGWFEALTIVQHVHQGAL